MSYGIIRNLSYRRVNDFAFQQAIVFHDGKPYESDWERCCNTFDNDPQRICWGNDDTPDTLIGIEKTYTTGFNNEDLLSFESHNDNADCIDDFVDDFDPDDWEPSVGILPVKYDGKPMGLAVVAARSNPTAFVYMAGTGCTTRKGAAYVPVSQYRDVALSDDVVMNVWVSDPLAGNTRLAFIDANGTYQLIGQLDPNFDLTPCNSINAPSSGVEAPDNSSCPA